MKKIKGYLSVVAVVAALSALVLSTGAARSWG